MALGLWRTDSSGRRLYLRIRSAGAASQHLLFRCGCTSEYGLQAPESSGAGVLRIRSAGAASQHLLFRCGCAQPVVARLWARADLQHAWHHKQVTSALGLSCGATWVDLFP